MKNALRLVIVCALALAAFGASLYVRNSAPAVAPVSASEAANPTKPYVVKLHAQWCAVCMMTEGVWSEIDRAYAGKANLVVFDLTNEKSTAASRAEARRLGLGAFFDEHGNGTGPIYVIDGPTKKVLKEFFGDRDFAVYRTAIDAALGTAAK